LLLVWSFCAFSAAFDSQAEFVALAAPTPAVRVQPVQPVKATVPAPSFDQVLSSSHTTRSTNDALPQPAIRGELVSNPISQTPNEKGIEFCKRNLRGRLILNKDDKPYYSTKIQQKLQKQWNTSGPWSLLSLGIGYFEFYFASEADMRSVWAMGTIYMKSGVLRLFEWTRDFNMHKQKNTHAQVWIRLMELP
jgi:hypothetical protein